MSKPEILESIDTIQNSGFTDMAKSAEATSYKELDNGRWFGELTDAPEEGMFFYNVFKGNENNYKYVEAMSWINDKLFVSRCVNGEWSSWEDKEGLLGSKVEDLSSRSVMIKPYLGQIGYFKIAKINLTNDEWCGNYNGCGDNSVIDTSDCYTIIMKSRNNKVDCSIYKFKDKENVKFFTNQTESGFELYIESKQNASPSYVTSFGSVKTIVEKVESIPVGAERVLVKTITTDDKTEGFLYDKYELKVSRTVHKEITFKNAPLESGVYIIKVTTLKTSVQTGNIYLIKEGKVYSSYKNKEGYSNFPTVYKDDGGKIKLKIDHEAEYEVEVCLTKYSTAYSILPENEYAWLSPLATIEKTEISLINQWQKGIGDMNQYVSKNGSMVTANVSIKGGVANENTTVFTLPENYRPTSNIVIGGAKNWSKIEPPKFITVRTNGNVVIRSGFNSGDTYILDFSYSVN